MRDLKARKRLMELDGMGESGYQVLLSCDTVIGRLQSVERKCSTISNLAVKDCPVCKHPVLAEHHTYRGVEIRPSYYQCFTCGVKFTVINQEMTEVLEQ